VNSALILLKNEGASSELIDSLAELDIDSLMSVDVKSVQLMMHEEMALLRSSLEGDAVTVPAASSTPTATLSVGGDSGVAAAALASSAAALATSKDAVNKLETENTNLRGLLKELKEELLAASKSQQGDGDASSAKISALTEQLSGLKVSSEGKELKLQEELKASQSAFSALESEHSVLKVAQEGSSGECAIFIHSSIHL
jgi:chromosome segregation ATPase